MRTLYAVVFISYERRRIEHVNVTAHPTAAWLRRQLIQATPWGVQPRFLIRGSFGGDWVAWTARLGIHSVLTPVRAPNANAIAERVIGTLRRECMDHVLVLNERHLHYVLREFVQHCNAQRPHRSLSLDTPERRAPMPRSSPSARLHRRTAPGGLINEYEWAA